MVKAVYDKYNGNGVLMPNASYQKPFKLTPEQQELLEEVLVEYGKYSAWTLRELTHQETPWRNAMDDGRNAELTPKDLSAFFKTKLN